MTTYELLLRRVKPWRVDTLPDTRVLQLECDVCGTHLALFRPVRYLYRFVEIPHTCQCGRCMVVVWHKVERNIRKKRQKPLEKQECQQFHDAILGWLGIHGPATAAQILPNIAHHYDSIRSARARLYHFLKTCPEVEIRPGRIQTYALRKEAEDESNVEMRAG